MLINTELVSLFSNSLETPFKAMSKSVTLTVALPSFKASKVNVIKLPSILVESPRYINSP